MRKHAKKEDEAGRARAKAPRETRYTPYRAPLGKTNDPVFGHTSAGVASSSSAIHCLTQRLAVPFFFCCAKLTFPPPRAARGGKEGTKHACCCMAAMKKVVVTAPVVGVDLGLKASRVACCRNDNIEVIANPDGNHATPSVVAFNELEILVGDVALAAQATNPASTVVECKRMLGVTAGELDADAGRWKFAVGSSKDGKAAAMVRYKNAETVFTGEQLCSHIITNLKATAEAYVHSSVKFCVLSAPAFFSDKQREALAEAAASAGFKVLRVISDPIAAAIAYGLDKEQHGDTTIAVVSMGARTCELAVLKSRGGILHQVGAASDHSIGGDEVHEIITNWAMDEFKKKHKMDPRESKKSVDRFRKACESAKRQLSQTAQVRSLVWKNRRVAARL